jgi:hypothetical protein
VCVCVYIFVCTFGGALRNLMCGLTPVENILTKQKANSRILWEVWPKKITRLTNIAKGIRLRETISNGDVYKGGQLQNLQ